MGIDFYVCWGGRGKWGAKMIDIWKVLLILGYIPLSEGALWPPRTQHFCWLVYSKEWLQLIAIQWKL